MDTSTFCREIGRQVRLERGAAGLTQRELADRGGVSERLVRSIEKGEAGGVSLDRLISVFSQLGIDIRLADMSEAPASTQDDSYDALLRQAVESWERGE